MNILLLENSIKVAEKQSVAHVQALRQRKKVNEQEFSAKYMQKAGNRYLNNKCENAVC